MSTTTQQERNADVVRRIAAAVSAGGDPGLLDELLTDDYVEHNPALPTHARGPGVIRRFVEPYRTAFPDLEIVEEDLIAAGDRIVFRHRVRGTHERGFRGVDPTGAQVEVDGVAIYRFEDGRAADKWLVFDALGLLRQLGVAPAAPASGE